jgi:hypothetical protein
MNYYIDTEFLEGTQTKRILGIPFGKTKPTIDLISIGIVAEDGRAYYAISKDFNLREAWNRYDLKPDIDNGGMKKVYWIRENVLVKIYTELVHGDARNRVEFNYGSMKMLLNSFGKTNAEIAIEIKEFVYNQSTEDKYNDTYKSEPKFYGYYADYDWVVFCWLFGKMLDLPKGFPKYCIDLKQKFDEIENYYSSLRRTDYQLRILSEAGKTIKSIKDLPNYPKITKEHNALEDARWNMALHKFLQKL